MSLDCVDLVCQIRVIANDLECRNLGCSFCDCRRATKNGAELPILIVFSMIIVGLPELTRQVRHSNTIHVCSSPPQWKVKVRCQRNANQYS